MRASFALASAVLALFSTASIAADPGPQVDPAPVAARLRPIDELLSSLPIPNGYMRVRASDVAIDRQTLHLIRYERADDRPAARDAIARASELDPHSPDVQEAAERLLR